MVRTFVLERRFTDFNYLHFLTNKLPSLLKDASLEERFAGCPAP
jgi:capsular polysaccharide biosynthesis protein